MQIRPHAGLPITPSRPSLPIDVPDYVWRVGVRARMRRRSRFSYCFANCNWQGTLALVMWDIMAVSSTFGFSLGCLTSRSSPPFACDCKLAGQRHAAIAKEGRGVMSTCAHGAGYGFLQSCVPTSFRIKASQPYRGNVTGCLPTTAGDYAVARKGSLPAISMMLLIHNHASTTASPTSSQILDRVPLTSQPRRDEAYLHQAVSWGPSSGLPCRAVANPQHDVRPAARVALQSWFPQLRD